VHESAVLTAFFLTYVEEGHEKLVVEVSETQLGENGFSGDYGVDSYVIAELRELFSELRVFVYFFFVF
jgi:hypothetical protein